MTKLAAGTRSLAPFATTLGVGTHALRVSRQLAGANGEESGPQSLGTDPATGLPVEVKSGRFGRYVQSGDKRSTKA